MARKKIKPTLDSYRIIRDAVDIGIGFGYRRAHKHMDNPTEETITQAISDAVMLELDNVIKWAD